LGAENFDHDQSAKLTDRTSMRIFDAGGAVVIHLGIEADPAETAVNKSKVTELDLTSLFPNDKPRPRRP